MKIYGISNGYPPNTIHIVWAIPHDGINSYQLYRNNVLIADSTVEEQAQLFHNPSLFDQHHGTNLFRNDIKHKIMYTDTNKIEAYRRYEYHVVAKAVTQEGIVTDSITSDKLCILAL